MYEALTAWPADAVRALRLSAGLTLAQSAALVGLKHWQTWQKWERGEHPADPVRCLYFAHLTGLARIPFGTIRPERNPVERAGLSKSSKIPLTAAGTPPDWPAQR